MPGRTTPKKPKPATAVNPLDLLRDKQPARAVRRVAMDPGKAQRLLDMEQRERVLQSRLDDRPDDQATAGQLDQVRADLEDLRDEVRDTSVVFVALGIGKDEWEELAAKHPPTKEQRREAAKARVTYAWDPDVFPPVAMRRCLFIQDMRTGTEVLHEVDDDLIADFMDSTKWNQAEVGRLLGAVLEANSTAPEVGDLGNE